MEAPLSCALGQRYAQVLCTGEELFHSSVYTTNEYFCLCYVGDYYNGPPGELDQEPDEEWVKSRQNEGRAYQEWDEDADVDESGEVLS